MADYSHLRTRLSGIASLILVVVLAVALTAAISNAALARTTFQSSPIEPGQGDMPVEPPAPTPDLPTETPTVQPTDTPADFSAPAAPPPDLPTASPTQPPNDAALPPGFLPAPTLTNPDALLPAPAAAQPPLVGPAAPPVEDAPPPEPAAQAPSAAELIDNGIIALSYVWLCCGALLLGAAALVIVWLGRRSRRR